MRPQDNQRTMQWHVGAAEWLVLNGNLAYVRMVFPILLGDRRLRTTVSGTCRWGRCLMATDLEVLKEELDKWRNRFNLGCRIWSAAYHVTAYGAVISGAFATYLAQQSNFSFWGAEQRDLTSLFSLLTTILAATSATGGFERKWRSSRLNRSRIDMLQLSLKMSAPELLVIRSDLQKLVKEHDVSVLGLRGAGSDEAPS